MKRPLLFILSLILCGIWFLGCRSLSPTDSSIKPDSPTLSVEDDSSQDEDVQPDSNDSDFKAESSTTPESEELVSAADELVSQLEGLSLAEFFEVSTRVLTMRSPETVLSMGLTDIYGVSDIQLDDISDAYQRETYAMIRVILNKLGKYDRAALSSENQISYDIYQWHLEDRLAETEFFYHNYPATYYPITAVHEDIIYFFTDIQPVESLQDAQVYLTVREMVGTKIDQLIEGLELRKEAGITPPQFAIQWSVYGSLGQFVDSSPRQTGLYTTLKNKLDLLSSVTPEEKQSLLDEAERVIEEGVLPAYKDLQIYLSRMDTYPGEDSGVWRLPDGDNYYANRLQHFTTTNLTADEIHQLGLQELDHIHAKMRFIFGQLGYPDSETLVQSFDRVAQDGGHVSGNDVLTTYEQLISEADQNLDAAFDIRPKAEVIVIGDQYGGFYVRGSMDGARPGAFYAAVGGGGEPYYAMPTLAYHEAIPGHHFQIALAMEMRDLPSFRQGVSFNAFAEGWALYAEQLAWELGWYEGDPYGELGFLQGQAFRAARLVVDTGLHAKGWTFGQAQEFFTENTGFDAGDPVNPQHQIARYLVWPGQSVSYYVGYLKIIELRQHAMDQLGDQFDLKEFHRVILSNGSMPLEILDRVVDQYIQEKLDS